MKSGGMKNHNPDNKKGVVHPETGGEKKAQKTKTEESVNLH